jgi:DNA polymerase-1
MSDLSNTSTNNAPIIFVDGHSLAFRSYYAFANRPNGGLRTSTGIPTSVCYGFLKSLLQVMESEKPQHFAIAFDLSTPTFRHSADVNYKSDRAEAPEDFLEDLEYLQELLQALNLPVVTAEGYEADDILGTLAQKAATNGYWVKILSGDRDLFQLIDDQQHIELLYPSSKSNGLTVYRETDVRETLQITPTQVVDFKALCGDKSDNIPGVKGIGEKTATKLLSTYETLDNIYEHIDQIKGATRKKLETGKEHAYHSQFMAKIDCNVPLEFDIESLKLQGFDVAALEPLLAKLELKQFSKQIQKIQSLLGGNPLELNPHQDSETENEDEQTWFFSAEDTAQQQQQSRLIQPWIIDTSEKLTQLADILKTQTNPEHPVAWDTETTALNPRHARLVGLGCCWSSAEMPGSSSPPTEVAYIPISHQQGQQLEKQEVFATLQPILEGEQYPKVLQNGKFDRSILLRCEDIKLAGVVFDTLLASYLLDPEGIHNLSHLAQKYLNISVPTYDELVPKKQTIADVDIPSVAYYCGMDVYTTRRIFYHLQEELAAIPPLHRLLLEVEQPLEPVLADMEYRGIRVNTDYLASLSAKLHQDLEKLATQAHEAAGEAFNLDSPKQLSYLLFEKLGLNTKKSRKTKSGNYSTDAKTLEKLQGDHPVVDAILEHRRLAKLKSTYVDALQELVDPDTQRVYTHFNQTKTSTGRLSSSEPNLQNIPIRTAFSRQIRQAFIPEEEWVLVAADYSQIELRILAHLSQEPLLLEAYQNNRDVHTLTAQLLFDKEEVTDEERRLGKTINFGVIYGMGAARFSQEAGVSFKEGKKFIERLKEQYPAVFGFLEHTKREAISKGYVETILGRRRTFHFASRRLRELQGCPVDEITPEQYQKIDQGDAQLLRAAANAPIQGSSADIIKKAMVEIHKLLQPYQSQLLVQVHDELILEMPPAEWEQLRPEIQSIMENAVNLRVPLLVEAKVGKNWMEAK